MVGGAAGYPRTGAACIPTGMPAWRGLASCCRNDGESIGELLFSGRRLACHDLTGLACASCTGAQFAFSGLTVGFEGGVAGFANQRVELDESVAADDCKSCNDQTKFEAVLKEEARAEFHDVSFH